MKNQKSGDFTAKMRNIGDGSKRAKIRVKTILFFQLTTKNPLYQFSPSFRTAVECRTEKNDMRQKILLTSRRLLFYFSMGLRNKK